MTTEERLQTIEDHIRALEREMEAIQSDFEGRSCFRAEPWPIEDPPKDRPFEAYISRGWTKLFWSKQRGVWDALDSRGYVDRSEFTEWREIEKP